MSYYGKSFVKHFEEMRRSFRSFRLAQDCVRSALVSVRDELTPEEYAILQARVTMDIATPPESMRRIARAMQKNGLKETEVSRQRVEQIIRRTIARLGEVSESDVEENEI